MIAGNPVRVRQYLGIAAAVVLPTAAVFLYSVPPVEGSFYPPCFFYRVTGLYCPGCGSTRCLHALLHGDLVQALAYNVFLVILLPPLAVWGLRRWYAAIRGRVVVTRRLPAWSIRVFFFLVLGYWILRNVNASPFNLLAPHKLERAEAASVQAQMFGE